MEIYDRCMNDPELVCLSAFPQIFSVAESRSNIKHDGGLAFGYEVTEERMQPGMGIQASARLNAYLGTDKAGPEGWRYEFDGPEVLAEAEKNEESSNSETGDEAKREEQGEQDST